jgi:hypothetical protein
MNCKCVHLWGAMSLLFVFLTTQSQAIPDPCNGRFELYDFNDVLDINTPTGWQHENYTAVVSQFVPLVQPGRGGVNHWRINPNIGLFPFEGNYFLILSTGNIAPDPNYAKVWQNIDIEAGDKLTGVYFFGTRDYVNTAPEYYPRFNDWADIKLKPTDSNLQGINLVHVTVENMGSFDYGDNGSMSGWKRFEYTFDTNQAGNYDLVISVSDYLDNEYDTYFAVDGLVLCQNPPQSGDLSCDCTVNFQDFALFAADWRYNCNDPHVHNDPSSDPNLYNDPNTNCLLGTDFSGNGPVDIDDLQILTDYWLEGIKE